MHSPQYTMNSIYFLSSPAVRIISAHGSKYSLFSVGYILLQLCRDCKSYCLDGAQTNSTIPAQSPTVNMWVTKNLLSIISVDTLPLHYIETYSLNCIPCMSRNRCKADSCYGNKSSNVPNIQVIASPWTSWKYFIVIIVLCMNSA